MHKKKVLFMINSMYGGGAEKIFQTLLNNLEPSKYDITVYSVNQCKIDHKYYPENIKYKYIFGGIGESTGQISLVQDKGRCHRKLRILSKLLPDLLKHVHISCKNKDLVHRRLTFFQRTDI